MIPDEREWLVQERATRVERGSGESLDADATGTAYLLIARALREPIEVKLADDFAVRVASLAVSRSSELAVDSRIERYLLWVLGAVFAVAAVTVCVLYGQTWFGPTLDLIGPVTKPDLKWILALSACVGVSWLSDWMRNPAGHPAQTLA